MLETGHEEILNYDKETVKGVCQFGLAAFGAENNRPKQMHAVYFIKEQTLVMGLVVVQKHIILLDLGG